ncbi:MAG: DUF4974 domain-containing protein [Candidatus Pedobacter colombiensis]|uniref:DUF4974 domain-containing protein n=1 Tax=Candidatus Pedobacter colombiensis TaxID=3121371 RepID=A0AAJ5W357_9SPHI|nr:FecR family protein [Pedobacter sp.]WEK17633.1 MAG: DUF4974 domain-containing protein [Pedobacter sp.]
MRNQKEITVLFKRYLVNQCSEEEEQLFWELLCSKEHELFLKDLIEIELKQEVDPEFKRLPQIKAELNKVQKNIIQQISETEIQVTAGKNRLWLKIAAVLILCISVLFFKTHFERSLQSEDIKPGSNKAVLTLADGSKILLDDAVKGKLTNQAGVGITKTDDGQVVYTVNETIKQLDDTNADYTMTLTNTIATPRGGQYRVNLPDGTKVWLNAATTLKFPLSFENLKERKVELQGEAYFEVEKNPGKPFIVQSNHQIIQVFGTHFNVDSYTDEAETKTTLLEGSVKITALNGANGDQIILKPGQQSQISIKSNHINVIRVDPMTEISWKQGLFFFENEPIENIMKKIARWYNVEVIYQDNVAGKTVWGSVTRYADVSKVLSILELTGEIHFKVEGRRIIVRK